MSDCEIAQYYVTLEPVANKRHECCECDAPILIDEKHLQIRACWEGRPGVYRQHFLCAKACEFVRDSGMNDDDCLYFGQLKEWYSDLANCCGIDAFPDERRTLWKMMLGIYRRERKALKAPAEKRAGG